MPPPHLRYWSGSPNDPTARRLRFVPYAGYMCIEFSQLASLGSLGPIVQCYCPWICLGMEVEDQYRLILRLGQTRTGTYAWDSPLKNCRSLLARYARRPRI